MHVYRYKSSPVHLKPLGLPTPLCSLRPFEYIYIDSNYSLRSSVQSLRVKKGPVALFGGGLLTQAPGTSGGCESAWRIRALILFRPNAEL